MSTPSRERAVLDAGLKAFSVDSGMPRLFDRADAEYVRASDEHGILRLAESNRPLAIGDKLRLVPGHCDPTVNLYDWYVGYRGERVESIWPIARGPGN
jgi:3-hydroxy-D-aspartate aldolase